MKHRNLIPVLILLLALALCACGGGAPESPAPSALPAVESPTPTPAAEEPTQAPAPSSEPGTMPVLPDAGLHAAEKPQEEDPEIAARRALAEDYLEKDAAALLEELGEPLERSYAPSCLGDGEDGEWVYEGFTVYTYREGDRETVKDVS